MTNGELKDIKRNYEELTTAKNEKGLLNEAIELYEQHPIVIKYLNLKRKLELIAKSHSKVEELDEGELLEYVINNIGIKYLPWTPLIAGFLNGVH